MSCVLNSADVVGSSREEAEAEAEEEEEELLL